MGRLTGILFLLALALGGVLFQLKLKVVQAEGEFQQTSKQIRKLEQEIHTLDAEWAYLNEPERLQKLAEKYLDLAPTQAYQIVSIHRLFKERVP